MDAWMKTGKLGKTIPGTSGGKEDKNKTKKNYPVPWVEK
jgi:hypothetical protein